ncbi:MAG TPA: hypothetical protein VFS08_00475 [Gemmatimonadaceae bacterium]|nr:hypothetical protein [Gemmatimonadaceae bacterium]
MAAIRARRSELSDQLVSASNRREEIVEQLKTADPAVRPGLEQRLKVLDDRIAQLETDIAVTGRQLTSAQAGPGLSDFSETAPPPGFDFDGGPSAQVTAISIVFTLFVLMPLAIALARLIWRRASRPAPPTIPFLSEASQRLERLEQAVDTIAIEIERVSENQRFVTRLLAEKPGAPALPEGQAPAEPIRVSQPEAVRGAS